MNRIIVIFALLATAFAVAAPPPKRSTVIFDPKSDAEAFSFIPSPATCKLHVVTSNQLVWVKYDGRQNGHGRAYDTTVYLQERIDQKPTHIVSFLGCQMPAVVGVSPNGSLLFHGGNEFIAAGDASSRAALDVAHFFTQDLRAACPFDVNTVTSPTVFMRRLSEDKTPAFTLPVFRKGDEKVMREISVTAVPSSYDPMWKEMESGTLPSPEWLCQLWPIVHWDDAGFTIWNGSKWMPFTWATNQVPIPK